MESGLNADILVCRTEHEISNDIKKKLALFCNVDEESVIQSIDASNPKEEKAIQKKRCFTKKKFNKTR
jgi:CTP synthase (UTP-ammonia lyase)